MPKAEICSRPAGKGQNAGQPGAAPKPRSLVSEADAAAIEAETRKKAPRPAGARGDGNTARDFMGVLKTLPGVVDTSGRDAPGWGSVGGMSINGRTSFNFSYDGVTNKDTGSNSGNYSAPGLDSIGEIRVQTSNFQAEYGRSSGATITGGLFLGLTRTAAARYSFLLSIPAVVLSGLLELRHATEGNGPGVWPTIVATVVAFFVGYASIAGLLKFLTTHSTLVFVVYRVVFGLLVIGVAVARGVPLGG